MSDAELSTATSGASFSGLLERSRPAVICLFYSACVLMIAWTAKPFYNGDLIGYMGTAKSWELAGPEAIQKDTYAELKAHAPPNAYNDMMNASVPDSLQYKIAADPEIFRQILTAYQVRPLYPALIAVVDSLGSNMVDASVLVSKAAYVGIGILLLVWLSRLLPMVTAAIVGALIMALPMNIQLAQCSTPDALSFFFYLLAIYFAVEKKSFAIALLIEAVAITARQDNIIFFGMLSLWALLVSRERKTLLLPLMAAGVAIYFTLKWWTGYYSYQALFYMAFIDTMLHPLDFDQTVSLAVHVEVVVNRALVSLGLLPHHGTGLKKLDPFFPFVALNLMLLVYAREGLRRYRPYAILAFVNAGNLLVHYLLFPISSPRFVDGMYIVTLISLLALFGRAAPSRVEAGFRASVP